MHKVLLTKKITKEQEALAHDYGLDPLVQNFIKVTLEYETIVPPKAETWIFTSSNASKYISAHAPDIPKDVWPNQIVAIGKSTGSHLTHLGLPIHVPDYGSADQVVELVKQLKSKSAVFFSGNLRRNVIPEGLKDRIEFYEFQVYQTELVDVPLDLSEVEGIAFFSPSGVKAFAISNQVSNQKLVAMGTTTKQAVMNEFGIRPGISATPRVEDVLFALKEELTNKEI